MTLDRGEKLEVMEDKASVLEQQGRQFHSNAGERQEHSAAVRQLTRHGLGTGPGFAARSR